MYSMSKLGPFMRGLTTAVFQSSRYCPVIRETLIIFVIVPISVSWNYIRNYVLHGSISHVV